MKRRSTATTAIGTCNRKPRRHPDFKDELPPRSTIIAENGCGDCLFLKTSAAGKTDAKVFVYWHEEERDEVFAKTLKELIATSAKNKAAAAKKPKACNAPAGKASLQDLRKPSRHQRRGTSGSGCLRDFHKSEFGLEALPMLRRALAEDDVSMVIHAAECIAMLGPEAATCPAGEASQPVAEPQSITPIC